MILRRWILILCLLVISSCNFPTENKMDYDDIGIDESCLGKYGPVPVFGNSDSIFDLDEDGYTNRKECDCESDPFDDESKCQKEELLRIIEEQRRMEQDAQVEQESEIVFDYSLFLQETTGCPKTVEYSLGYVRSQCEYTGVGEVSTPEDCHDKAGIGCVKFLQSLWSAHLDHQPSEKFADLPWGDGNTVCAVGPPRAFFSSLVDATELLPGDIFSAEFTFAEGFVPYKETASYGHAGMFIGYGKLDRIIEEGGERWMGLRYDLFAPMLPDDPEARAVVVHSTPPSVTFSYLDELFVDDGPFTAKWCRPKFCDKDFDLNTNTQMK